MKIRAWLVLEPPDDIDDEQEQVEWCMLTLEEIDQTEQVLANGVVVRLEVV